MTSDDDRRFEDRIADLERENLRVTAERDLFASRYKEVCDQRDVYRDVVAQKIAEDKAMHTNAEKWETFKRLLKDDDPA